LTHPAADIFFQDEKSLALIALHCFMALVVALGAHSLNSTAAEDGFFLLIFLSLDGLFFWNFLSLDGLSSNLNFDFDFACTEEADVCGGRGRETM